MVLTQTSQRDLPLQEASLTAGCRTHTPARVSVPPPLGRGRCWWSPVSCVPLSKPCSGLPRGLHCCPGLVNSHDSRSQLRSRPHRPPASVPPWAMTFTPLAADIFIFSPKKALPGAASCCSRLCQALGQSSCPHIPAQLRLQDPVGQYRTKSGLQNNLWSVSPGKPALLPALADPRLPCALEGEQKQGGSCCKDVIFPPSEEQKAPPKFHSSLPFYIKKPNKTKQKSTFATLCCPCCCVTQACD